MRYNMIKLGEVVDIDTGFAFKSEKFNTNGRGYRLVRGMNVTKGNIRWGKDTFWWDEDLEFYSRYYLGENDIVVGMDGSLVGKNYAKIKKEDLPALLVQRVARIKAKNGVDQEFIYNLIANPYFVAYVDKIKTGTSIPHISLSQIKNYEIPDIPESEQKKIGYFLGLINTKIDLNNKINNNLVQMASSFYKEKCIKNKDLCEIKTVSEIVEFYDAYRKPLSSRERDGMEKLYPYYGAASLVDYVNDYVFDGDYILVSEDGANVVNEEGYPLMQYVWGKFWVNNHAHIVKGKNNISDAMAYFILSNTCMAAIVTGAVQPKINQANLKGIDVILPVGNDFEEFKQLTDSIINQSKCLLDENENLISIRELLLPKLISGEVELPE